MSIQGYTTINQERLNPEFIGIAQKFSSFKKSRLSLEQKRNRLIQNLKYKMSVDRKLSHSLDENKEKLKVVQKVNYRHQLQLSKKRQNEVKKRKQLNQLNQMIQATRSQNHKNLRDSMQRNYSKKRKIRQKQCQMSDTINFQMRSTFMSKFQEKRTKFREIQSQKRQSQQIIKDFYLDKNAESLNNYKNMIQNQEERANLFQEDIEIIESTINNYDNKIQKKKKNLLQLMDKISLYTLEPVESQAKSIPLYLRNIPGSATSHSSRPSDILLKGPKNIILNQSFQQPAKNRND